MEIVLTPDIKNNVDKIYYIKISNMKYFSVKNYLYALSPTGKTESQQPQQMEVGVFPSLQVPFLCISHVGSRSHTRVQML